MLFKEKGQFDQSSAMIQISDNWFTNESALIKDLSDQAYLSNTQKEQVKQQAINFIKLVRKKRLDKSGIDAFMIKYDLSNQEGIMLMCLAEALLRIPDKATIDKLIADKNFHS